MGLTDKQIKSIKNFESKGGKFRDYIKVIHMYVPSGESPSFIKKQETALSLATRFCPNAKIFMESKQDEATTATLYSRAKGID
jgi:hypothetical protein